MGCLHSACRHAANDFSLPAPSSFFATVESCTATDRFPAVADFLSSSVSLMGPKRDSYDLGFACFHWSILYLEDALRLNAKTALENM